MIDFMQVPGKSAGKIPAALIHRSKMTLIAIFAKTLLSEEPIIERCLLPPASILGGANHGGIRPPASGKNESRQA
jgi:hypothetical protein